MSKFVEIVFNENTKDEYRKKIFAYKGRKVRNMVPKIKDYVISMMESEKFFDKIVNETDELGVATAMLDVITKFWKQEEFEAEILPIVLQMDDLEGLKFLENEGTPFEVFTNFNKCAMFLVETGLLGSEVESALKKSTVEQEDK